MPDTSASRPLPDAARARLVLAHEACELAELARAAVPVAENELCPDGTARAPGATLAHAAHVAAAARRFLAAAAVFERLSGADWGLVGDALGLSTHDARAGFARAEARFLAELRAADGLGPPRAVGELSWWRAYLVREPWEAARDLDEWVVRHRDGDVDHGAAPVSGALLRARGLDGPSDPS